jgi:hypothetical protein
MARKQNVLGLLLRAGSLLFVALVMAFSPYWPVSFVFFYSAVLMLGRFKYEDGRRRRRNAEQQWWARQKRGIVQPPLEPCCLRHDDTGFLHDLLCTRDRSGEVPTGPGGFSVDWDRLAAVELGNPDSGEGIQ